MKPLSRRKFIKGSLVAAGTVSTFSAASWAAAAGANEDVRVAVVGLNGKGRNHIGAFNGIRGVRLTALCDVDKNILGKHVGAAARRKRKVTAYTDCRKLLDDKNIDAIVIATPNHWHALLGIWACQAGKDVYVEKPCCHNVWEGQKFVEAARKYNRIVQHGTQSRSDKGLTAALAYLREGHIGKITLARGLCYKRRGSIGKVSGAQKPPESVDYDLWTGPAPLKPLMRGRLHYDWHWVWDTGNGDIGNQGVHEMDMCRWAAGQEAPPRRVMSIGGRFGYDDDGETANTQIAIFDYDSVKIIFEVRGLTMSKTNSAMNHYKQRRVGLVVHCEGGYYAGGGGGGWVYDNKGERVKRFAQHGPGSHQANFIAAVRSRKIGDLNADVLAGYRSAMLCHLPNVSHRVGKPLPAEEIAKVVKDDAFAAETFDRFKAHLVANGVDVNSAAITLGPRLKLAPDGQTFTETDAAGVTKRANALMTRNYRAPYVVPEKV